MEKVKYRLTYLCVMVAALWPAMLSSQCLSGSPAFRDGEHLEFEVAYNWGMLWVNAGRATFTVDSLSEGANGVYSFDSYGESYRFYDWFYKVRDRFRSHVEADSLRPVWFMRDTYEGGYAVNNTYTYDWDSGVVISDTENSRRPRSVDTLPVEPCTFDVLSAIYYARSLDFENRQPGEKIPLRFIIDGQFYDLFLRYLGKEVKENRDGKAYLCHKFSALLVEGTIFKGGEDLVAWVTADANKIPVMVEAKILIGSVKAYLTGYDNLLEELRPAE